MPDETKIARWFGSGPQDTPALFAEDEISEMDRFDRKDAIALQVRRINALWRTPIEGGSAHGPLFDTQTTIEDLLESVDLDTDMEVKPCSR